MKYATVILAIAASAFVLGCSDSTSTGPDDTTPATKAVVSKAASSISKSSKSFSAILEGIDEKSGPFNISGRMIYTITESPTLKRRQLVVETFVEAAVEAVNGLDPSFKFAASRSSVGTEDEKGNAVVEVWYAVPDCPFIVRMSLDVTRTELSVAKIWLERGKAGLTR